jgi:3-methylfumaryl-CoA hydratase
MTDKQMIDMASPGVSRTEACSLAAVRRVAAMLGLDPDDWQEGDLLPRGWQFILLGADTPRGALRGDGFPGLGVPLPDLGLPRLLIGGRSVCFVADITIGASLRRDSRIETIQRKETARGPMALVTVAHELSLTGTTVPALVETQTYVLLGVAPPAAAPASDPVGSALPAGSRTVVPDDTLLFQYSALGFNSHRIHLDRAYARDVEGFPDLVVNGGLTTLLLTEHLRTAHGVSPSALKARYLAPLFCARPMTLSAEARADGWGLRAFDDAGRLAVDITVEA